MATLTQLFPVSNFLTGAASGNFTTIYVHSTSIDSPSNGGACCLFTVPTGTSWIRFEVWGGGSAGPGACCCQQPVQSGGAGAYARRTVPATAGNTYTVCAGGSTGCMPTCCGTEGNPSFVSGGTGGSAVAMCAAGGPTSFSQCFMISSGCAFAGQNTNSCRSGSFCGADFGLPAISGASQSSGTCGFQHWQYVPNGPYIGAGVRTGWDYCIAGSGCQSIGGFASFPGGGGGGAQSHGGGCCWGNHGAGGLVIISYR